MRHDQAGMRVMRVLQLELHAVFAGLGLAGCAHEPGMRTAANSDVGSTDTVATYHQINAGFFLASAQPGRKPGITKIVRQPAHINLLWFNLPVGGQRGIKAFGKEHRFDIQLAKPIHQIHGIALNAAAKAQSVRRNAKFHCKPVEGVIDLFLLLMSKVSPA